MGSRELSERDNWQRTARLVGDAGEKTFAHRLARFLPPLYIVTHRPKKLKIYGNGRGIILDCSVENTETGMVLYIENKTGNNGGNAHERAYKFLSAPLRRLMIESHRAPPEPFFFVFTGQTFQKQKYKDELALLLADSSYAIMDSDYGNIEQVAEQIMEIV